MAETQGQSVAQQGAAAQKLAPKGELTGAAKAALWLLSAEEETAIGTLKLLGEEEVVRLREAAETMQKVSPEELARVHQEFKLLLEQQPLRVRGSVRYLHRLTSLAMGDDVAGRLMRRPEEPTPAAARIGEADLANLTVALVEEHPQIIAAVVSALAPNRAQQLLERFDAALRDDVLLRLARMTRVPHEALGRAQQLIAASLPTQQIRDVPLDGVRLAATLLNEAPGEEAERSLVAMGQLAEPLSAKVRQAMFTYEDLLKLDRRGMQTLLKDVPSDRLLLSLKAASEELRAKIFASLSKRAAEMMQEDLQSMGPTKLADVEAAQADVVAVAIKLRDENKIVVGGGSNKGGML